MVIGGSAQYQDNILIETTELYKYSTGKWTYGVPLPNARFNLRAITLDNLVYATGWVLYICLSDILRCNLVII